MPISFTHIFFYLPPFALRQVLASSTYLEWFMVVVTIYGTSSLVLEETTVRSAESLFHFVSYVVIA